MTYVPDSGHQIDISRAELLDVTSDKLSETGHVTPVDGDELQELVRTLRAAAFLMRYALRKGL